MFCLSQLVRRICSRRYLFARCLFFSLANLLRPYFLFIVSVPISSLVYVIADTYSLAVLSVDSSLHLVSRIRTSDTFFSMTQTSYAVPHAYTADISSLAPQRSTLISYYRVSTLILCNCRHVRHPFSVALPTLSFCLFSRVWLLDRDIPNGSSFYFHIASAFNSCTLLSYVPSIRTFTCQAYDGV